MFCDISPTCYKIALQKEICKRHIKDFFAQENYADTQDTAPLPCIVAQYSSHLIKRGKGIDPVLQENKAVNIRLANEKLNGILIRPGETFSFWHRVGKTTKRKGYRDGRILVRNHILRRRAVQPGKHDSPRCAGKPSDRDRVSQALRCAGPRRGAAGAVQFRHVGVLQ